MKEIKATVIKSRDDFKGTKLELIETDESKGGGEYTAKERHAMQIANFACKVPPSKELKS